MNQENCIKCKIQKENLECLNLNREIFEVLLDKQTNMLQRQEDLVSNMFKLSLEMTTKN